MANMMTPAEAMERRVDRFEQRLKCLTIGKAKNHVASLFQRLTVLKAADAEGIVFCVTCGRADRYNSKAMQAGHYYSRMHSATLFCTINCHPQCSRCNGDLSGNMTAYHKWMQGEYGTYVQEWLEAEHNKIKQWTKRELAELKVEFLDGIKVELKRINDGFTTE